MEDNYNNDSFYLVKYICNKKDDKVIRKIIDFSMLFSEEIAYYKAKEKTKEIFSKLDKNSINDEFYEYYDKISCQDNTLQ